VWAVAAAAAVLVFIAVGIGGVVYWMVWKAPGDGPPLAAVPTAGNGRKEADRPPAKMPPFVTVARLPKGGSHPQAVMGFGVLHLVYFMGDPRHGDIFYVCSTTPQGIDFSKPLRVNSQPGSACLADPGCGPQFAPDRPTGQVHVVWSGPPGTDPGADCPVYYARQLEKGSAFEPQRDLAGPAGGRGPALAAHVSSVCVFWNAPGPKHRTTANRLVWLAKSIDTGTTFAQPRVVSPSDIDVCPNSLMCALETNPGMPVVLYRGATDPEHRDMYLLYEGFFEKPRNEDGFMNDRYHNVKLHTWKTAECPSTTAAVMAIHNGYMVAWETEGQIYFSRVRGGTGKFGPPVAVPGRGGQCKHPALAFNGRDYAVAWIESAGKETSVCWQIFNHDDQPMPERGEVRGIPAGSRAAVFTKGSDGFVVVY
jgi:hypothetical protein